MWDSPLCVQPLKTKGTGFQGKEARIPMTRQRRATGSRNSARRTASVPKGYRQRRPQRKKQKRKENYIWLAVGCLVLLLLLFTGGRLVLKSLQAEKTARAYLDMEDPLRGAPPLDVELLTVNPYSRPGTPLEEVKYVAIHYTANPGSTAKNNRDYFEGLKDNHSNEVSSHFVVGLEGEIVQCIPTNEISYATNSRNVDTLSIECCHLDETGKFNEATYQSLVELTAYLCNRFGLDIDHVIRHYDVTGKNCPKYYVEHPEAWEQLKKDISAEMEAKRKELE
ncbi:N-acetylmuramoyl-L-alanine amidase [Blautia hydrogenotrophica DSM 10507]|uniref:N-acetylmuramoyl-L-alanine amidase n=2 Tax=Blautia hydrogenotrophica TaxID=53443 RepID=C0CQ24_BLAHS|nr:N-acetylmuramoyl-L-alanine amidase [Blautia hydrogenotrophica DSM 10507]